MMFPDPLFSSDPRNCNEDWSENGMEDLESTGRWGWKRFTSILAGAATALTGLGMYLTGREAIGRSVFNAGSNITVYSCITPKYSVGTCATTTALGLITEPLSQRIFNLCHPLLGSAATFGMIQACNNLYSTICLRAVGDKEKSDEKLAVSFIAGFFGGLASRQVSVLFRDLTFSPQLVFLMHTHASAINSAVTRLMANVLNQKSLDPAVFVGVGDSLIIGGVQGAIASVPEIFSAVQIVKEIKLLDIKNANLDREHTSLLEEYKSLTATGDALKLQVDEANAAIRDVVKYGYNKKKPGPQYPRAEVEAYKSDYALHESRALRFNESTEIFNSSVRETNLDLSKVIHRVLIQNEIPRSHVPVELPILLQEQAVPAITSEDRAENNRVIPAEGLLEGSQLAIANRIESVFQKVLQKNRSQLQYVQLPLRNLSKAQLIHAARLLVATIRSNYRGNRRGNEKMRAQAQSIKGDIAALVKE